LLNIYYL